MFLHFIQKYLSTNQMMCTDFLFSEKYQKPLVSEETFKKLIKILTCDILMLTHNGYYQQKDDLSNGSPPAPLLANGWLCKYDHRIQDNAKLYSSYMDNMIRSIKAHLIKAQTKGD